MAQQEIQGSYGKKAVMYGAGAIGRGFIGQVFHDSGYEVIFIDIVKPAIEAMNRDRQYPLRIVSNEEIIEKMIDHVRAIDAADQEAACAAIAAADIMATSVGVNNLPRIAGIIARGLQLRFAKKDASPLNILICENLIDAGSHLSKLIAEQLPEEDRPLLERTGFVEASIGRMVPIMTPEMFEGNILRVWVEPYCQLPLDEDGFRGPIPDLAHVITYAPFRFYEERKLYIHNLGHAMTAYLGFVHGYHYIYEAIADQAIRSRVNEAMLASARSLSRVYGVALPDLEDHVADLISRFGNRALGDTVARVGQDPLRKLKAGDRFLGALERCREQGISYEAILEGIAAALRFERDNDPSAGDMQKQIAAEGVEAFVGKMPSLSDEDRTKCLDYYRRFG
jgi:mannitol-1-phosphate 5-dehydrogenase